jgi:hypothetical protein
MPDKPKLVLRHFTMRIVLHPAITHYPKNGNKTGFIQMFQAITNDQLKDGRSPPQLCGVAFRFYLECFLAPHRLIMNGRTEYAPTD